MPYIKPDPKARKKKVSGGTVAKQVASGTKNYIRDEMLGFDDFGRAASKAKSGDVLGAAKSGLTGVGELGLTAASVVAGFFTGGTGAVGIQAAKAGAKQGAKEAVKKTTATTAATAASKEANKAANKASSSLKYSDDVGGAAARGAAKPGGYPSTSRGSAKPGGYPGTTSKPGGFVDDIGDAIRGGLDGITKKFWIPKPGAPKGNQFKKDDGDWNGNRRVPTNKPPLKPMDTGGGRATRGVTVTEAPPSSTSLRNFDTPFDPYSPKMNPWPGMPAVKPAPAPAPRKPVVPKPSTPKVKPQTTKPDAAIPALKTKPQTTTQTKTETSTKLETSMKPTTKPALKTQPPKVPIRIPVVIPPRDEDNKPDKWAPSAIV